MQPAAAGLLIGLVGLGLPQVLGAGYESIDQAMHDQFGWRLLVALCVFKLLATAASFVTGTPGGLFAPTLFMGAMLGGAVCAIERLVAPGVTGPIGAYALVGMGTMFAGIMRAPMTSVFMIVEVSGNYSIILPVMISNTIAYLVSRQFQKVGLFDLLAQQDGTNLPSMEEEREVEVQSVEDAMRGGGTVVLIGRRIGRSQPGPRRRGVGRLFPDRNRPAFVGHHFAGRPRRAAGQGTRRNASGIARRTDRRSLPASRSIDRRGVAGAAPASAGAGRASSRSRSSGRHARTGGRRAAVPWAHRYRADCVRPCHDARRPGFAGFDDSSADRRSMTSTAARIFASGNDVSVARIADSTEPVRDGRFNFPPFAVSRKRT